MTRDEQIEQTIQEFLYNHERQIEKDKKAIILFILFIVVFIAVLFFCLAIL